MTTAEQDELKKQLGELFNSVCHWSLTGSHMVTEGEREVFLNELMKWVEERSGMMTAAWLTQRLLKTERRYDNCQDRAAAMLRGG